MYYVGIGREVPGTSIIDHCVAIVFLPFFKKTNQDVFITYFIHITEYV